MSRITFGSLDSLDTIDSSLFFDLSSLFISFPFPFCMSFYIPLEHFVGVYGITIEEPRVH